MTIYVGNLSFRLKETELKTAFSEFGEVTSVKIIKDKTTRKSKGYGFVEMETEEAAENAINGLNGKELAGRPLRVHKAHQKENNTPQE